MSSQQIIFDQKPKQILVRMPNWLGDFVMATPILTDLRHHWPEAKITAVCQGVLSTLLQGDKDVDHIITMQKNKGLWHRLRRDENLTEKYDLGLLLTNSFSSAYHFWRSNVKITVGYADHFRSLLMTHPISYPKTKEKQHLVITYKQLLTSLGIPLSQTLPRLYISEEEKRKATEFLMSHGMTFSDTLIGINPGAAYGPAKCWPKEKFKDLIRKLLDYPHLKIAVFGDSGQVKVLDEICANYPTDRVFNLGGKTNLRELIALIEQCRLFLTNDSGPMHVASALGVPLIALFGSTSDIKTGPYRGGNVIHKRLACSPCYKRNCPIDFQCMKSITTEEVYEALKKIGHF